MNVFHEHFLKTIDQSALSFRFYSSIPKMQRKHSHRLQNNKKSAKIPVKFVANECKKEVFSWSFPYCKIYRHTKKVEYFCRMWETKITTKNIWFLCGSFKKIFFFHLYFYTPHYLLLYVPDLKNFLSTSYYKN